MSIHRIDSGTYSYNLIKRALDVSSLRGKVIANNMANINTAGYKRMTVSFEDTLKNKKEELKERGYVSSSNNLYGNITCSKDNTTSMRQDGNNIDLDVEKANQASNTLMFNALITGANSKLNMTKYVITGGGR